MTASSAWGVQLPSDGRGVVTVALRGQDCNPASCSGRKDGWVEGAGGSTRATQRRIASGRCDFCYWVLGLVFLELNSL